MKYLKLIMLLPIFSFLFSLITLSCEKEEIPNKPTSISNIQELTEEFQKIYEDSKAPGFTVSVVKNNEIIYQNSFGKANIESDKPYSNQTLQPIGSVSKTFVAIAVLKAISQGYFTLETDINDILPFEITNPKHPQKSIKVKHLVTHTSGLMDNNDYYLSAYYIKPGEDLNSDGAKILQNDLGVTQRNPVDLKTFLENYYTPNGSGYSIDNFSDSIPGTSWNYSNIATSLAAFLVETVSEMPFKEYMTTFVFNPLEMNQTSYLENLTTSNDIATLYFNSATPFPLYGNDSYPDGSIQTNNEDLSVFLLDMMKGVKGEASTLFDSSYYNLLFQPQLEDNLIPNVYGDNQGVFWFLKNNSIQHDGSDPGTTCALKFNQAGTEGFFLLSNMDASTNEHTSNWFKLYNSVNSAIQIFLDNQ